MKRSLGVVLSSLALLALLPATAAAQQVTAFDGSVSHTDQTGAFLTQSSAALPGDMTQPEDYSTGMLHYRVDVTATPGMRDTTYAVCFVQGANTACSDYSNLSFMANGEVTGQQAMNTLTNYASIDWTMAIDSLQLVATDTNGYPVDSTDTMWDGSPDFALYYPLDLTFQAVVVANGGTFAGFPGMNMNMQVETPVANPGGGSYSNSVQVELTTATNGATIYYTTDGSDPTDQSTEYTNQLTFTADTTLKAIAYAANMDPSAILTEAYTVTVPTSGLRARYYNGRSFGDLQYTRVDPSISFTFADGQSPAPDVQANNFSILWSGTVTPQYSGAMTFLTRSDDGVRVWVNNQLVIDNWNFQGPTDRQGDVQLTAFEEYDIWVEYFNGGGSGEISLSWESAEQPNEIISDSFLSPVSPNARATVSLFLDEDDQTVAETQTDPVQLTISRRGALDQAVRVGLTFSGTAVNGEDYEQIPAFIDIPAGELSASFDMQPIIDGVVEDEEQIIITLAEDNAYNVGAPSTQTINLLDFDENTFTIAGEVIYTGTESGKIFVRAFTDDDEIFEAREIVLLDPGNFAIPDVQEGSYNVVAFIDVNDNERLDPDEIWNQIADAEGNPGQVLIPSPESTMVVIDLDAAPVGAPPVEDTGGEEDDGCSTVANSTAPTSLGLLLLGLFVGVLRRRRN